MKNMSKKRSLSEQLKELSIPKPISFHPDQEELTELSAAKVCEFSFEEEADDFSPHKKRKLVHVNQFEDDPRYSGRAISRKDIQDSEESSQDDGEEDYKDNQDKEQFEAAENNPSDSEENSHMTDSDQSEITKQHANDGKTISTISFESLKEDIEKGKAARHQLALWDGLLETRIKLHKILTGSNRLPQGERLGELVESGGEGIHETLEQCQSELKLLIEDLLALQRELLQRNSETRAVVGGTSNHGNDSDEVTSESEDEEHTEPLSTGESLHWVREDGSVDYEGYISQVHQSFHSFRDDTITKWNKKTRIAGGKLTSKSFMQVDQTVLSQIKHVLADKPRLLKRTQLKRSVYRVLGTCKADELPEPDQDRDAHLRDYDTEIFDDDDFYHQLLRELIERKMEGGSSSDPVAMGRQWLALQRLRAKAKRKVDTRASKGRKIRYNVHPKLANFMVPIESGTMSDVSKNDLFSSLFGGTHNTN